MPVYTDAVRCKYSNIGRYCGKEHIITIAGGKVPFARGGEGGVGRTGRSTHHIDVHGLADFAV